MFLSRQVCRITNVGVYHHWHCRGFAHSKKPLRALGLLDRIIALMWTLLRLGPCDKGGIENANSLPPVLLAIGLPIWQAWQLDVLLHVKLHIDQRLGQPHRPVVDLGDTALFEVVKQHLTVGPDPVQVGHRGAFPQTFSGPLDTSLRRLFLQIWKDRVGQNGGSLSRSSAKLRATDLLLSCRASRSLPSESKVSSPRNLPTTISVEYRFWPA